MNTNNFIDSLSNFQIWEFAKIPVALALIIYIVFAVVVVRQVNLMTHAINLSLGGLLKVIAYIHLLGAIFVLLVAMIIL